MMHSGLMPRKELSTHQKLHAILDHVGARVVSHAERSAGLDVSFYPEERRALTCAAGSAGICHVEAGRLVDKALACAEQSLHLPTLNPTAARDFYAVALELSGDRAALAPAIAGAGARLAVRLQEVGRTAEAEQTFRLAARVQTADGVEIAGLRVPAL